MSVKFSPISVMLFFTQNVSLKRWENWGILERETILYKELVQQEINYSFLTYGNNVDLGYQDALSPIKIYCNEFNLPHHWYQFLCGLMHRPSLNQADIFKTNRIKGAHFAVKMKNKFRKKLIVRSGDIISACADLRGIESEKLKIIKDEERYAFNNADNIFIPTKHLGSYIIDEYHLDSNKVKVVPNYVDTDLFKPKVKPASGPSLINKEIRICTIAKNNMKQKNLQLLLRSIAEFKDTRLVVIGEACENDELKTLANQLHVKVDWLGTVNNELIPTVLNGCDFYVQPSIHEGHPKSLLEAMACAVPVIGCQAPGVTEIISNEKNGLCCEANVGALREAIDKYVQRAEWAMELGRSGRQYVLDNCSLKHVAELEQNLYKEMLNC
jgi:glycosyltransferase involved in cell wall biosynthesis